MLGRAFAAVLIVVHLALGLWALVGFAELAAAEVPWPRLSNPLFTRPMLFLQWTLIAIAATLFVAGYRGRWPRTPIAMAAIYGAMALTCAYQTFFILTSPTRFRAMAIEYAEYAVILVFLFFSEHMRHRFAPTSEPLAR